MMIDQAPASRRHAIEVEFLGRPALVDRAPAVLAAATRVPLVAAASRRDARGNHVLHVLGVHLPPDRPNRRWVDQTTVAVTRSLDRFVREHPTQWLWLHRRWKGVDLRGCETTLAMPCSTIRSSLPDEVSTVASS